MQSLRLNQKVKLVGFDSSPPLLNAVAEGDIEGLILQDPYRMGYLGVWNLMQHLEGFDVAPGGDSVQGTGEHLVTKANLESTAIRELFTPELQAKRTIETPTYAKRK
jgi:ribose transport system substrate-binding protein